MVQGVACPNGRPQHSEITPVVDFGTNFADLSRMTETETEKDIAKTNVEILGIYILLSSEIMFREREKKKLNNFR